MRGQKVNVISKRFPTAETVRRAHVSDFLPGAILQLFLSVQRLRARLLQARPNLLLRQPRPSTRRRSGAGCSVRARGHTLRVINRRNTVRECTAEAELSALQSTGQSVLQSKDGQRREARLRVCVIPVVAWSRPAHGLHVNKPEGYVEMSTRGGIFIRWKLPGVYYPVR